MSVLLIASLLFGILPTTAHAASSAASFAPATDIYPERTEYRKGEEINIRTRLNNDSLNDLYDLRVWMEYDGADTMLVPGATERIVDELPYLCTNDLNFWISETKITDKIEATNNSLLINFTLRIVRLIPKLSKFFAFLKNDLQRLFTAFPSLWRSRYSADLGECTIMYDGREIRCIFKCSYQFKGGPVSVQASALAKGAEQASVRVKAPKNGFAGIVFGAEIDRNGSFSGWLFYINASDGAAGIVEITQNGVTSFARRKADIPKTGSCTLCVQNTTGGVKARLLNDLSEKDSVFPLFDIALSLSGDEWGLFKTGDDVYSDLQSSDVPFELPKETYCNPVHTASPDPYVLYEDGVYYLYSTNAPSDGFYADVSTDLVHWKRHGKIVADKKDLYGERGFWAPEVYRVNGKYYMLYTAEERLAVATADSPLGPFKKAGDGFLIPEHSIDGSFFFDESGKIYMYYAHATAKGECLYVTEMEPDLLHCKDGTKKQLSVPEGWEEYINEGPTVLKHNGTYYLTYSGQDYRSANYGVGCMISSSPTGPFTRDKTNPILQSNTASPGCGHHCFASSPDGSEMFIVYHRHLSSDAVHPRSLCIDRVQFVKSESGADRLVIGGPTSTPQPMPK
ncbi:MAG: glycoside hydrolase family 43 protein [Clostridiales bacterium]|nr:glycoside hydrolase family 43 protein [Clostridiales bacterium]